MMLIVLILIIWLGYTLINKDNSKYTPTGRNALDILDERYARGEINEEEYIKKRELLRK